MIKNNYLHYPKCYSPLKVDLSNIAILGGEYKQLDLDKEKKQNIKKKYKKSLDQIDFFERSIKEKDSQYNKNYVLYKKIFKK